MKFAPVLALSMVLASSAIAQEHHRQLGAHKHGRGFLNVAIEGNRVSIEFQAPGSDIARSETKPNTPERKAAVESAIAMLEKPMELFRFPSEARCEVTSASATMTMVGDEQHHEHATTEHDHANQANQPKQSESYNGGQHSGHSDYHASGPLLPPLRP